MKRHAIARAHVAACILISTVAGGAEAQQRDLPPMSEEARAYLEVALDTLQSVSWHADSSDWDAIRDSAFLLAAGARTTADTYGAIAWALGRADRHSFLQFPRNAINPTLLDERFGYLRVPFFAGPVDAPLGADIQAALRSLDGAGACGWLLDLRMNGGGNVWPMQLGIAPLLGDSVISVEYADGRVVGRTLYVGGATIAEENGVRTEVNRVAEPYVMAHPGAPVAVLIDNATGSSAEALAIAFRTRPNTRFFGEATSGYSSINRGSALPDGANMVITIGAMTDRHGRVYGVPIEPDEVVDMPQAWWPSPRDAVARAATAWLGQQPACSHR